MANSYMLAMFKEGADTFILCDASGKCLGATLMQTHGKEDRVICYASRSLSETEQRYWNTERELMAIVWAVTKKFRFHAENRKIKVYTDHKPLVGGCKLSEESHRAVRLWMKLEKFEITIERKAGVEMGVADALSRYVAGAAIESIDRSELIWNTDRVLGHRSWKVV
jgi:RNase H-like domain found in reverse transcriptase